MSASVPVSSLMRGLLVLEAANTYGPAGLSEIAKRTGLPKATVFRMLENLTESGYLSYDAKDKTYQVGLRTLALSNNVSYERQLLQMSAPIMTELREQIGWPSDLAVFEHGKMVIVDTNREPGMLSVNRRIGSRIPMMASATGRAYLGYTSQEERTGIMEELRSSTDPFESLAKDAGACSDIFRNTVKRGYAVSDQEFLPTNRGAAVAVLHEEKVVCVINLIVLAKVVKLKELEERYAPMLLDAKSKLETLLCRFPLRQQNPLMIIRHSANGTRQRIVKT